MNALLVASWTATTVHDAADGAAVAARVLVPYIRVILSIPCMQVYPTEHASVVVSTTIIHAVDKHHVSPSATGTERALARAANATRRAQPP